MRDSKYSILFMRDDTDVRRFRVSPFWLRGYIIAQVVLVVIASASLWLGITSFSDNAALRSEKADLSKRLEDAELRLSTLGNMEKILEAYDKNELQALLSATPDEGEDSSQKAVDLAAIFTPINPGLIQVEEIKATLEGNSLTVNFKIENPKPDSVLSGVADLAMIATDGSIFPLDTKASDLAFQIQRRKFARTSVELPEGVNKDNAFGLRISIKRSDGKVIFSETYPLYHILS